MISEVKKDSPEPSKMPEVTAWDPKELKESKRRKIFSKTSNRYPLTQEILGKNLAGLIKQNFLKTVSINDTINKEIHKIEYTFHFPSITMNHR